MKIKILASNREKYFDTKDYIEEYVFEYNDQSTIEDMKKELKIENYNIYFSKYHYQPVNTYLMEQIIPYIEVNGKIYFDVDLEKVKIVDFLNTYKIKDTLEFEYNINGIGGGPIVLEILKNVAMVAGIYSSLKDVKEFVQYINKNLLKDKNLTNKNFLKKHNSFSIFSYIYSENNWNHYILGEKLNIESDVAKNLLIILGYNWDNSKKIYNITDEKKDSEMEKISNIEFKLAGIKEEKEMKKYEIKKFLKTLIFIIVLISIITIIYTGNLDNILSFFMNLL